MTMTTQRKDHDQSSQLSIDRESLSLALAVRTDGRSMSHTTLYTHDMRSESYPHVMTARTRHQAPAPAAQMFHFFFPLPTAGMEAEGLSFAAESLVGPRAANSALNAEIVASRDCNAASSCAVCSAVSSCDDDEPRLAAPPPTPDAACRLSSFDWSAWQSRL